ncbi:hypothetical protein [Desulfobotulus sp.]|nr:hypothetical protein [Desulfobotulus sp.]MDY0162267.1 hypothetical protein [Desulfobotulus sp.]
MSEIADLKTASDKDTPWIQITHGEIRMQKCFSRIPPNPAPRQNSPWQR